MKKEYINVVKASISLNIGDTIQDRSSEDSYKISYIDYIYDMVIIVETEGNGTDAISFDDIAYNFQKVVE